VREKTLGERIKAAFLACGIKVSDEDIDRMLDAWMNNDGNWVSSKENTDVTSTR